LKIEIQEAVEKGELRRLDALHENILDSGPHSRFIATPTRWKSRARPPLIRGACRSVDSLGMFRERVISHWWRALRRRSQKSRVAWPSMLALAGRWIPRPQVLHPYPDARFLARI
jgi:hypothetical protein